MSLNITNHQTKFTQGINEAKAKNFFVPKEKAASFGISEQLFAKLDFNHDGKINYAEAQISKDPAVLGVYKTQAPAETAKTSSIKGANKNQNTFMKDTFAFGAANPDKPESRSQFSADLLNGSPVKGKELYLLG